MTQRYLYRLTDGATHDYARPTIHTAAYPIVRETAKCYVIKWGFGSKFVLKDPTGKRWAYLDLKDAQASYRLRKKRQALIYATRHDHARAFLAEVEDQIAGTVTPAEPFFVPWEPEA